MVLAENASLQVGQIRMFGIFIDRMTGNHLGQNSRWWTSESTKFDGRVWMTADQFGCSYWKIPALFSSRAPVCCQNLWATFFATCSRESRTDAASVRLILTQTYYKALLSQWIRNSMFWSYFLSFFSSSAWVEVLCFLSHLRSRIGLLVISRRSKGFLNNICDACFYNWSRGRIERTSATF